MKTDMPRWTYVLGWMDRQTDTCMIGRWMDRLMDGQAGGWMDGRTGRWMDELMAELMGGQMDG